MTTYNRSYNTELPDPLLLDSFEDDDNPSRMPGDADEPVDPSFVELLEDLEGFPNQSPDLYAVLGVSTNSSAAEIRAAYKRFSLLLHPDRHATGGDNPPLVAQAAETAFGRICSAYAVLSDPNKRAIYDAYGHEGLNMQGWELASCEKSAAELRLEYLMLKQKAEADKLLKLTQPTSEFTVGLDLSDLFDRYLQESPEERIIPPSPSINHLYLAQSITAGLSLKNSVSLAGQVTARNGLGVGTWMIMWRHQCDTKSVLRSTTIDSELSYGRAGRGLGLGLRFRRPFGNRFVGSFGFSTNMLANRSEGVRLSLVPGFSTGWDIQLSPQTQARIVWRWNIDPGLLTELVWSFQDAKYITRLSASLSATGRAGIALRLERVISCSWFTPPQGSGAAKNEEPFTSRNTPEWARTDESDSDLRHDRQGRLFGSVDVNTSDLVEFSFGVQCSISLHSRLFGSLSFSLKRGVSIKLSLQRGTQTYSLPITLSNEANVVAAGYGLMTPLLLFGAVRTLLYEPYLNRQLQIAQKSRRSKLKGELLRRRHETLATQSLMRSFANRIREGEAGIGGLVVVRATYGFLPSDGNLNTNQSDIGGPLNVDVTIPIQALVEQSHLRLPPGRWSDLQGFYDPCLGISQPPSKANALRQLRVVYLFHGCPHEVTVSEDQGLAIPMTKHKIDQLAI